MKSLRGSNLVEYAIPIALIAMVVGLGLYYIYSSGLLNKFFIASGDMKVNKSTGKVTLGANLEPNYPGALGGTSDAPVKKCDKGKCTVDFGDFILTGIPDNFKDFVESQGNAGGTDELAIVFEQLAEHLLEDGDDEGYQQYMDMANLCHYLAKLQRNLETGREKCMADENPSWCFSEALRNYRWDMLENDTTVPDFLKNNPDLFAIHGPPQNGFSSFFSSGETRIDLARQKMESGYYETRYGPDHPIPPYRDLTHAIVGMYDTIMNNPKYSDNLKSITTLLYKEIDNITFDQYIKSKTSAYAAIQGGLNMSEAKDQRFDPINGNMVETVTYYDTNWNPRAATETDLDSAIICTAGNNSDTGQECK